MQDKSFIRVWQDIELGDIEKHLLVGGDVTGDCAACREVGIDFQAKVCPKCKTVFKYIGTRISKAPKEAKRLKFKRPDLIVIDYSDFKEAQSRGAARNLLG